MDVSLARKAPQMSRSRESSPVTSRMKSASLPAGSDKELERHGHAVSSVLSNVLDLVGPDSSHCHVHRPEARSPALTRAGRLATFPRAGSLTTPWSITSASR